MGEGFFSKLKVLVGIEEVEEEELEEEAEQKTERRQLESRSVFPPARRDEKEADSRVVPMASKATGPHQLKMIIIEPKAFDECPRLVDSLKAKKPVIINLEKLETDTARKIFDFLSGATYALNGNVQKVANNIFVFAPENVDVAANTDQKSGGYLDSIKNPWR